MRFSFRKTFSLLHFHRRSKSETSAAAFMVPALTTLPRSLSLNDVDELASDDTFIPLVPGSYPLSPGPPFVPVAAAHSPASATPVAAPVEVDSLKTDYVAPALSAKKAPRSARSSASPGRVSRLVSDLAAVNQRIILLEAENTRLKEERAAITLDATIATEELANYRSDFYSEQFKINALKRTESASDERYEAQDRKLFRAGKFIESMIELGLHKPVLARTWDAIRSDEDPDDALVDAIKKAAAQPGSSWSRIIPAVTGPRTSDQYLSAINMTLKTRKELKHSKAVANFWKRTAKMNPAHETTLTPSSSDLEIVGEQLSEGRQTAVDDLLAGIRNGEVSFIHTPRSAGETETASGHLVLPFNDSGELNETITVARAIPPALSDTSVPASTSASTFRDSTSSDQQPIAELAPLASQVFKQELISSCSVSRSLVAPSKPSRPVLGNIDINRDIRNPKSTLRSADSSKSGLKALGKRRAMIVTESIDSITVSLRSSDHDSIVFDHISEPYIPTATSNRLPGASSDILSTHKNTTIPEGLPSTPNDILSTHKNITTSDKPTIHKNITTSDKLTTISENLSTMPSANYHQRTIYKPVTIPSSLPKNKDIINSDKLYDNTPIATSAKRLSTTSERPTYSASSDGISLSTSSSLCTPSAEDYNANTGTILADRALLSLERICAGFESGSLGSLRTIDEESEEDDYTLNATATSAFTSKSLNYSSTPSRPERSVASSDGDESGALENTFTPSTISTPPSSPVKNGGTPPHKSMLPVFKNLRRLSASLSPGKKSSSTSPPPSLVRRPTTSSALKAKSVKSVSSKPISPKKPVLKAIAPLVIKKNKSSPTSAPLRGVVAPAPAPKVKIQPVASRSSASRPALPIRESRSRRAVKTLSRIIS